jgi:hypothetical protein
MGIFLALPDLPEIIQKCWQVPGIDQAAPLVKGAEVALFQKRILGPDILRKIDPPAVDVPEEEVFLCTGTEQVEYIAEQSDG